MTRTLRAVDGDGTGGDPLPHNITAEQAVLGAAMLSPAALAEARALLDGSDFYRPAHQIIWQAITDLADRGDPHDPLSVGARLGNAGLAKSGGAPYLHTLIAAVPSAANAAYYAHIVRDLAYARTVLEASTRLAEAAWQATGDGDGTLRGKVAAEAAALAECRPPGLARPGAAVGRARGARLPAVGAARLAGGVRRVPRRRHPDTRRPRRVPRPRRPGGRRRRKGLGAGPRLDRAGLPLRRGRAAARQPQVRGVPRHDRAPKGCRAHADRRRPAPHRRGARSGGRSPRPKPTRPPATPNRPPPGSTATRKPPRSSTPPRPASNSTAPPSPPSRACSPTTPPSNASAPGSPSKAAASPSCHPRARSSPSPPGATPAPRTSASSSPPTPGNRSASTG